MTQDQIMDILNGELEVLNEEVMDINSLPCLPKVDIIPANMIKDSKIHLLGIYRPDCKEIVLDAGMDEMELAEIFIHEFGHFLHHVLFDYKEFNLIDIYDQDNNSEEVFAHAFTDYVYGRKTVNVNAMRNILSSKIDVYL